MQTTKSAMAFADRHAQPPGLHLALELDGPTGSLPRPMSGGSLKRRRFRPRTGICRQAMTANTRAWADAAYVPFSSKCYPGFEPTRNFGMTVIIAGMTCNPSWT
jgi:hypothetical protein